MLTSILIVELRAVGNMLGLAKHAEDGKIGVFKLKASLPALAVKILVPHSLRLLRELFLKAEQIPAGSHRHTPSSLKSVFEAFEAASVAGWTGTSLNSSA